MKHPLTVILIALWVLLLCKPNAIACGFDGNQSNGGSITPTAGYQTQAGVFSGQYFSIAITCGDTYNFNFCNNGGSSAWDTQITILNINGTTQYAYNDDACGLQSDVSWTATFSGTVYVLVSQYSCNNLGGSTGATMAYNVVAGASDPSFTISSTSCNSASSTITGDLGGTFSFNPVPGDGAVINASTGVLTNGTAGATYTIQYTVSCGIFSIQPVTLPLTGNADFTLTVACGGGTSTITGDVGGVFAFNPAPGDGAQINTSSGLVTNGTVGTTYYVQYTVCGTSSIESVAVLDDNCWTLSQSAQYIDVNGEQCIQLTDELNNQTGCAWNGSLIDFATNFTLTLDYYFGNNIGGADGNTFTFQPSSSTACGTGGGQLGAGGIASSLAIEFDTYDNDNPTHIYDMSCDHIAVEIDGNMQNGTPYCGPVCAKSGGGNIDDGGTYTVDIAWNATTEQLQIYFDGVLRLSCNGDFVNTVFGGQSQVYWGATSATGGLNNQQYFCPSTITILPVELALFESRCEQDEELFLWTTVSEDRVDYFDLEYTYDGLVFYPVERIDAVGTSTVEQNYSARVNTNDSRQRYYRLKMTDENGEFESTGIISGKGCNSSEEIIKGIIVADGFITVQTNQDTDITIVNQLGQIMIDQQSFNDSVKFNASQFSGGVYFVIAQNGNGIRESKKMFVPN